MLKEVRSVHKHLECSVVAISFIYSVFMRLAILASQNEKILDSFANVHLSYAASLTVDALKRMVATVT